MADRSRGINEHLRTLLRAPDAAGDADLLARFVADRDEEAFAALVRRHGAMVFGVCRRVLRGHADAEDAFQATFLVLARRAGAIGAAAGLANWLHGVAYRTALEARRAMAVRRAKEQRAADLRDHAVLPGDSPPDLREVLDRELAALPDVYRSAVVLCDLEGLARREAAHRLGWSEGTLSGRLFRARALLARRLEKYGLAVPGGVVGAVAAQSAAAGVPAGLAESTVRIGVLVAAGGMAGAAPAPVAALTEGVMKAMLLTKLKGMTAALMVGCAVLVTAAAGWQANAAGQPDRPGGERAGAPGTRPPKSDKDRIAELERERDQLLKQVIDLKVQVADLEADRRSRLDDRAADARALLAYMRQLDQAKENRPGSASPAGSPNGGPPTRPADPLSKRPEGLVPANVPGADRPPTGALGPGPAGPTLPGAGGPLGPGGPRPASDVQPHPAALPPGAAPGGPMTGAPAHPFGPGGPAPDVGPSPMSTPGSRPGGRFGPTTPMGPGGRSADMVPMTPGPGMKGPVGATPAAVSKVYAVEDLAGDEKQAEALIRVVRATVEPQSWGTSGSVEYFPLGKALVIRHTSDAQRQVAELLALLRESTGKKAK
ncbi:MAG: hypothetical protein JWO38_593 [Gemmataceae bacterium]|nr:hypothetical protein [Gemmataceae bacterium]